MRRIFLSVSMVIVLLTGLTGAASAAQPVAANGHFEADIDFESFTFTPVGANCQLQVEGEVTFSGTIQGTGQAVTTALVFAPCSDVEGSPPGAFRDVFSSEIDFSGTLDGNDVTAGIRYHGTVAEGGAINAVMNFSGDLRGSVKVDGQVAAGGKYSGKIVLK